MVEKCDFCGDELQVGDWPFCKGKGSHVQTRSRHAQGFIPIVYFRNQKGELVIPGRSDAPTPSDCTRHEIATLRDYEKFQKTERTRVLVEHERQSGDRDSRWQEYRDSQRAELRQAMQHMSPQGRALAQAAIEYNNQKSRPRYDPLPSFEVFEMNASNRHEWNDPARDRRQRK